MHSSGSDLLSDILSPPARGKDITVTIVDEWLANRPPSHLTPLATMSYSSELAAFVEGRSVVSSWALSVHSGIHALVQSRKPANVSSSRWCALPVWSIATAAHKTAVVFVYDSLLHLSEEVDILWRRRPSLIGVLYFITRYVEMLSFLLAVIPTQDNYVRTIPVRMMICRR